jgi:hypothetical protein
MDMRISAGPPRPEGRAAPNEKSRPRREAAPSKTAISATGNQGSYIAVREPVQAAPFGASILDRLLAADVAALIQRNPSEFAAVLAEIGDELGIRGELEQAVFRRARRGPAARVGPRLVWSRSDGGAA